LSHKETTTNDKIIVVNRTAFAQNENLTRKPLDPTKFGSKNFDFANRN
jgi:hypothetical protein